MTVGELWGPVGALVVMGLGGFLVWSGWVMLRTAGRIALRRPRWARSASMASGRRRWRWRVIVGVGLLVFGFGTYAGDTWGLPGAVVGIGVGLICGGALAWWFVRPALPQREPGAELERFEPVSHPNGAPALDEWGWPLDDQGNRVPLNLSDEDHRLIERYGSYDPPEQP
jgi:hypothetical protein